MYDEAKDGREAGGGLWAAGCCCAGASDVFSFFRVIAFLVLSGF